MSRNLIAFLIAIAMLSLPAAIGAASPDTVMLPILMYHHVDDTGDEKCTVSADTFESHLKWLTENGYTAVSVNDVIAYVRDGSELPDKPYCIVFDDGYESNLTLALPILMRYSAPATVCIIGASIGGDTYKDTGVPIIPHFNSDGAREMLDSGLVTLASHTWDMHMYAPLENGVIREYAVKLENESAADFETAFRADYEKMREYMEKKLGIKPYVFAYPHGVWDMATEELLKELGVAVTMTCEERINIIRRGDTDSLCLLGRYNVNEYTNIGAVFEKIHE